MFSELCRETLRKAAVCYSAGRSGSPSHSPPTSPPPSPAKEAKIIADVELANVNRTNNQIGDTTHNASKSQQDQGTTTADTDTREITHKNWNTTEDRKRRTSMLTNFGKRSPERRRIRYTMSDEYRSASVERDYYTNRENRYEPYYRDYRRYKRDSSGSSSEQDDSSTSGDEAGAAPEETNQRSSSAHNRHSLTKEQTMHWFANVGGDEESLNWSGRESTGGSAKDLDRVKLVRERQNEERQRKLEELRNQALAAQRFREQREEERRRRIDELRSRDMDRRTQVEERKRLIWEAERERREAILRKNQEREARIEAKKKNERSHIVFAFGSSTPRMLEPADTGGSSFWGTRRATSTTNVMMFPAAQPLTRRSSERELDGGSKKRATSAGGLDRKPGEDMRMSSSMYEVFNWNSSPDPSLTHAKNKRASLSLPPTTDIFAIDDKSDCDTRRATVQRPATGDDNDGTPGTPSSVYLRVNRRRTDLMPTIPSPRDGPLSSRSPSAKAFTRSPGRTYSMSRLDQLSQPRKPRINELSTLNEQQQPHHNGGQNLGASSMSRSMSHLAAPGSKTLKRTDNSRSMGTLPGAVPLLRPTRAEKLRRKAREQQNQQYQQYQGVRSGEVTPNSPSRPHSSMSQQSGSSVASSNVNLRPRTSTPRRPRPASIAGTGVTVTERNNLGEAKAATKDSKPPLPKVHTTPKKPSTPRTSTETPRKPSDRLIKSAKASPRVTPKATPLQSPGTEQPPLIRQNTTEIIKNDSKQVGEIKVEEKHEEKRDQGSEKCQDIVETNNPIVEESDSSVEAITVAAQSTTTQEVVPSVPPKEEIGEKKSSPEPEVKTEGDVEEIVDMSASMIAKIRITTEEEAKAALAERRRLAREQAEREAEIERQRLEEEERLEMERQRAEEEEQRRLEEETLRLASEAREAEEQRLQLAIEDAKRREEEDRKRREEEARQKLEKEEAERKAREEAEKQRLEMVERLKKEEEERIARRKRVEAIMKRTRGGNNQANTTTKGDNGDGDKSKDDSPSDECKPMPGIKSEDVMTASLISEATQQLINAEQQDNHPGNNSPTDVVRNGTTHSNGINDINKALLENNQSNVEGELNGHHTNHGNGINTQITLDNATVKQNNVTNNLLDLSEFDTLSNSNKDHPILEMSTNLSNEDSLNSNLNPGAMPFTPMVVNPFVPAATNANTNPFQDNFTNIKTQDNNQLPDLLS
ncbi:MAP7 domain-containing protein 1 isoform X5 [Diachasma alloeum]|uniref:MAP7 domain-containing protein 1 isoform X5 n=1 Tax=Diachasma alloeum TaxID=454923 RepID=UPI0007384029|nr:MAP7 domain-containing protein 1 isoform X5 [Diachasma alloeum]